MPKFRTHLDSPQLRTVFTSKDGEATLDGNPKGRVNTDNPEGRSELIKGRPTKINYEDG